MPRSRWATPVFVVVVVLSLVVLFLPRAPAGPSIPQFDKIVHAGLFGVLAASTRWRFGRGLTAVLGYAGLSEVLQAVLPIARDGDPLDALADSVGAVLAWLAMSRAVRGSSVDPGPAARVVG